MTFHLDTAASLETEASLDTEASATLFLRIGTPSCSPVASLTGVVGVGGNATADCVAPVRRAAGHRRAERRATIDRDGRDCYYSLRRDRRDEQPDVPS